VLGLLISGVRTEATLNSLKNNALLNAAGDAVVSAQSAMLREMTANAAAAGGSVGLGGSFAISVVNDSARAHLRNSVKAGNVRVNAVGRSSMKSTSRAGANGAASNATSGSTSTPGTGSADGEGDSKGSTEKSEADKQADKAISSGISMAGATGSGNLNAGALSSQVSGRQLAQTSEGNTQVAAAFVLNIQKNISEATIDGSIDVETPNTGKVSVNASNNTIAAIYGNASATKAKIGVGVAVAINVVTYDNLAKVGEASITTGDLEVTALMYKDLLKQTVTLQNNQGNTFIEKLLDQAFEEMFEEINEYMGLKDTLGSKLWEDFYESFFGENGIIAKMIGDATNTLLSGTGLQNLVSTDIQQKIESRLENVVFPDDEGPAIITNFTPLFDAISDAISEILLS